MVAITHWRVATALLMVFAVINSGRAEERYVVSGCRERAAQFLSRPSKETLSILGDAANDSMCWSEVGSTNESLNRLLGFVENGNPWGAKYLAQHLNRLDGGNLEDSLVALGQFADRRVVELLKFAKSGYLSDRELADALTMLPLSMSDDLDMQLKAMQKRRAHVAKVRSSDLAGQRAIALKAIDSFIAEIVSDK